DYAYACLDGSMAWISKDLKTQFTFTFDLKFLLYAMSHVSTRVVLRNRLGPLFTWVFFLATKDETSGILKSFLTRIENLVDRKRKNMTLIEADKTMLADSKLPITFWAEAVNTGCYVQNRVLVVKPHNKTLYELFHGRTLTLCFMRPFGCLVTMLNTIDHLGKFDGKADEGFFVRYTLNSKAVRVFNNRTRIVKQNLYIRFSESTPNVESSGPDWLFNIDSLTRTMNYEPIVVVADMNNLDTTIQVSPIPTIRIHKDHPLDQVIGDFQFAIKQERCQRIWRNMGLLVLFNKEQTTKTFKTSCLLAFYHRKNLKRLRKDQEKDKIGSKPDKNRKRAEAGKC
nr:hypothetical protein [Tanacetum cinerariifolium]